MIKLLVLTLLFFASETNAQQVYNKLNVKELDVTSRVNVTSTTKSSKPCPAMTETQRNAIATPLNGSCIYNTTTLKLNVYNGTVWKAAGGGVDNWLTATAYSVNDIVIESSKIYQCLIAHTSGTFATDLAASRWVEISSTVPVNLTGPITSVGNATSIASQTGTGSTFVVQNTPTLTTPNIGAATGTSLTLAGNISAYNYDKDNLLVNGNVENPLSSEWTCTVGTCTRTTVAGEFSKDTAALKVALSAQAMNVSQTVTTPSGIQKQGFARAIYRVPSTMADFQVCTLVDAAEQNCIPTANLVKDDTFRSIEIPLTFGSTSAGIKFKTTSSYTANAYFDGAILSQGLGLQNLQTDNVYTAQANISAVVSQLNKPSWIGNGSISGAIYTYPITGFTVAPNCWAVNSTHGAGSARLLNTQSTATTVAVEVTNTAGATSSTTMSIGCQKSGNDYLASSANVYSQASGNYDWTSYDPALTGFGTSDTILCKHRRVGGDLEMNCSGSTGTSIAAALATFPLPNSLALDSTKINSANTTANVGQIFGTWTQTAQNQYGSIVTATGTSTSVVYFALQIAGASGAQLTAQNGSAIFNASQAISFYFKIPISGWTNSSAIVGSFAELGIKLQTSTATTSGTSVDYTIPVGVKRITVMFNGVSTNGTSDIVIRLGSGSVLSSGYVGSTGAIRSGGTSNGYAFSSAFNVNVETIAADNFSGISNFNLTGSNTWAMNGSIGSNTASRTSVAGGYVPVGGVIDRLRVTTANGTDTFDAGSINVSWEY